MNCGTDQHPPVVVPSSAVFYDQVALLTVPFYFIQPPRRAHRQEPQMIGLPIPMACISSSAVPAPMLPSG